MVFELRTHPDHNIVVFRYRGYDISIHNGPFADCAVFSTDEGRMTSGPVKERIFSGDVEGICKAKLFIDRLAGPIRICTDCEKPVGSGHKYSSYIKNNKNYWRHRCCRYPEAYPRPARSW